MTALMVQQLHLAKLGKLVRNNLASSNQRLNVTLLPLRQPNVSVDNFHGSRRLLMRPLWLGSGSLPRIYSSRRKEEIQESFHQRLSYVRNLLSRQLVIRQSEVRGLSMLDNMLSFSLTNTGIRRSQSLWWDTAPSTEYGSFVRKISPDSMLPFQLSKPPLNDPNCPPIIFPLGSAMTLNSSCCSRIAGLMLVRVVKASISSLALRRACSKISTVTVSCGCDPEYLFSLSWFSRAQISKLAVTSISALNPGCIRVLESISVMTRGP